MQEITEGCLPDKQCGKGSTLAGCLPDPPCSILHAKLTQLLAEGGGSKVMALPRKWKGVQPDPACSECGNSPCTDKTHLATARTDFLTPPSGLSAMSLLRFSELLQAVLVTHQGAVSSVLYCCRARRGGLHQQSHFSSTHGPGRGLEIWAMCFSTYILKCS